uniref:Proteasomal ATPase second OB domain-containing protein n=1 Tax=Astatotilapia calliptera TaxID=8154 RepID=A0AAX7UIR1_ASTCA
MADTREKALQDYRKKLLEHKEVDGRLKELREQLREQTKQYEKSENDLKALQSVGQIVGEVLKQLTEEKFIVKATNGPRYVVGCRRQLDKSQLKPGTRVALDMTTLTIMRYLPREVDPLVYNMSHEDPGSVSYSEIGGLSEQIRELRESCGQSTGLQFPEGESQQLHQSVLPHSDTVTQLIVCLCGCCRWCPAPLWTSTLVRVPG